MSEEERMQEIMLAVLQAAGPEGIRAIDFFERVSRLCDGDIRADVMCEAAGISEEQKIRLGRDGKSAIRLVK